jgi:hypothetical protein
MQKYRYPALRIAYIDEKEVQLQNGKIEKQYYSVLVKGDDEVLTLCCMNLNIYFLSISVTTIIFIFTFNFHDS